MLVMAASSDDGPFPWETQEHEWEAYKPQEEVDDEMEVETDPPKGSAAGDVLAEFLMTMHLAGKLSAKSLCVIAYWASRAGAKGKIQEYSYRPEDPWIGHYQAKVDRVNGLKVSEMRKTRYHMRVPGLAKWDFSRSSHHMPVSLPHEALLEEIMENPGLLEEAKQKRANGHWPEVFYSHPVVRTTPASTPIMPLALYMDGIAMTRNESIFGIFIYSLLTMRRHLIAVLRKSFLCKCGCGGRDTMEPIFHLIRWSLESLAKGRHPTRKHDGSAWSAADGNRCDTAGQKFNFRGCLVYIKADWAEFTKSLGFSTWASALYPCPFCRLTKEELYNVVGFNHVQCAWPLLSQDDMERATAAAEIRVILDKKTHAEVVAALRYQKQKQGPRGRGLLIDMPNLGLQKGDRLSTTPNMLDVADFDNAKDFPVTAVFWRRSSETRTTFRNPLWDANLGVTHDLLAVDILHALFLGPALAFVGFVLWWYIDSDVWGLGGEQSKDTRWQLNVQQIRTKLNSYYSEVRQAHRGRPITQLENFTLNMMGKFKGAEPNFKAAETKHVIGFVVQLMRDSPMTRELGSALLGAGEALMQLVRAIDENPGKINDRAANLMHNQYKKFMQYYLMAGIKAKPKLHLVGHLINRASRMGNPRLYGTFEDEGLNGILRSIGASVHRSVWEYRVLANFAMLEAKQSRKRKHP